MCIKVSAGVLRPEVAWVGCLVDALGPAPARYDPHSRTGSQALSEYLMLYRSGRPHGQRRLTDDDGRLIVVGCLEASVEKSCLSVLNRGEFVESLEERPKYHDPASSGIYTKNHTFAIDRTDK